MLVELKVSNFAIIENVHLKFGPGLNILSGDTGAGKSILIKSLSLVMGHKGSIESIRTGQAQASIEGVFDLSQRADIARRLHDQGIEIDDDLLVVRRVLSDGKSRVYLNGVLAPLGQLRELISPLIEMAGQSAPLIEMTSQFDNRNLVSKSFHLETLDQFGKLGEERSKYETTYQQWLQLKLQIEDLTSRSAARDQRLDFLKFQNTEMLALDLQANEDEEIEAQLKRLKSSEKLLSFAQMADELLIENESSVNQSLKVLMQKAQDLGQQDPQVLEMIKPLHEARALVEETHYQIQNYAAKIENGDQDLDTLEDRLSRIRKLQKKFGPRVEDVLQNQSLVAQEISELENLEGLKQKLELEMSTVYKSLRKMGSLLHEKRVKIADKTAKAVNTELADLNMKGVHFIVCVEELAEIRATGLSDVEFQIASSAKDTARPLAKAASGGELSRILLALKKVVGSGPYPRTFLFDEVDTGVSGPTADRVGRKLKEISLNQQVICVTHLPQVAAFAARHFYISKNPSQSSMAMDVDALDAKTSVTEIARLLSGEKVTKASMTHAADLLKQAKAWAQKRPL